MNTTYPGDPHDLLLRITRLESESAILKGKVDKLTQGVSRLQINMKTATQNLAKLHKRI